MIRTKTYFQNLFYSFLIICCTSVPLLSQSFQISAGIRNSSALTDYSRINKVEIKSANSDLYTYYPLGLHFELPITERFNFKTGIQFSKLFSHYLIYEDTVCLLCPVAKAKVVATRTMEFPQEVSFSVIKTEDWRIDVIGAITPTLNFINEEIRYEGEVRSLGWTEDVITVYNSLPSITKRFYFNYSIGVGISYWRLHLSAYWQNNMGNMVKPLEFEGKYYKMNKSMGSANVRLAFTFLELQK